MCYKSLYGREGGFKPLLTGFTKKALLLEMKYLLVEIESIKGKARTTTV